jgi:hypothetical protein
MWLNIDPFESERKVVNDDDDDDDDKIKLWNKHLYINV